LFSLPAPAAPVKAPGLLLMLLRAGYHPGALARVSQEVQAIDPHPCEEVLCPECLAPLAYRSFHKQGSYRVVGLCTTCGATEEF
jgi:hypothetical protein